MSAQRVGTDGRCANVTRARHSRGTRARAPPCQLRSGSEVARDPRRSRVGRVRWLVRCDARRSARSLGFWRWGLERGVPNGGDGAWIAWGALQLAGDGRPASLHCQFCLGVSEEGVLRSARENENPSRLAPQQQPLCAAVEPGRTTHGLLQRTRAALRLRWLDIVSLSAPLLGRASAARRLVHRMLGYRATGALAMGMGLPPNADCRGGRMRTRHGLDA
jgi:hypothetical protein